MRFEANELHDMIHDACAVHTIKNIVPHLPHTSRREGIWKTSSAECHVIMLRDAHTWDGNLITYSLPTKLNCHCYIIIMKGLMFMSHAQSESPSLCSSTEKRCWSRPTPVSHSQHNKGKYQTKQLNPFFPLHHSSESRESGSDSDCDCEMTRKLINALQHV
jgi:hypothetical protein